MTMNFPTIEEKYSVTDGGDWLDVYLASPFKRGQRVTFKQGSSAPAKVGTVIDVTYGKFFGELRYDIRVKYDSNPSLPRWTHPCWLIAIEPQADTTPPDAPEIVPNPCAACGKEIHERDGIMVAGYQFHIHCDPFDPANFELTGDDWEEAMTLSDKWLAEMQAPTIPAPLRELEAAQERIAQLEAALQPLSKMYHDLIAEGYDVENNNHRLIVVIVLNAGAKEEYTGCDLHSEEFRNAAKALKVEKAS